MLFRTHCTGRAAEQQMIMQSFGENSKLVCSVIQMIDLELLSPQNMEMYILEESSAIPASCYRNRILLHI